MIKALKNYKRFGLIFELKSKTNKTYYIPVPLTVDLKHLKLKCIIHASSKTVFIWIGQVKYYAHKFLLQFCVICSTNSMSQTLTLLKQVRELLPICIWYRNPQPQDKWHSAIIFMKIISYLFGSLNTQQSVGISSVIDTGALYHGYPLWYVKTL